MVQDVWFSSRKSRVRLPPESPNLGFLARLGRFFYHRTGSLVLDESVGRDGGNPGLAGSEGDFFSGFVSEDDLRRRGGLFPGSFYYAAVLEDVSVAGTNRGDVFVVVVVGGFGFLDDHSDNNRRRKLSQRAARFRGDFAALAGAIVNFVRQTSFVAAAVGVCLGIIIKNRVKVRNVSETEGEMVDFRAELICVSVGGFVDF